MSNPSHAQGQRDYTVATQLMKQEQYNRALNLLEPLLKKQPRSLPIFQQTMECMIQLKKYDEAIVLVNQSIRNGLDPVQGNVTLAELYHLNGSVDKATQTWKQVIEDRSNLGTYLTVARSMKERGEYDQALEVYEQAQQKFENGRLFLHEVAYTYLLAGKYEAAMQSFVQLIIQNPRRFGYVQRNLQRFSDQQLYDAAIIETEQALNEHQFPADVFNQLVQLDLWLLMERELYDRAVASVSNWVRQGKAEPYLLVDLGRRLRSAMSFNSAIKAFERAISYSDNDMQATTQFERARTFEEWAVQERHQNRLATVSADSLYSRAKQSYQALLKDYPYYSNRSKVYTSLSEISLDVNQDTVQAKNWLSRFQSELQDPDSNFEFNYLKGKIALFQQDFMTSRIHLTRALKVQKSSQQREHMRYLLGLADFYEGDYEFARTQLDALKQQSTSLFANDALQLKLWLNEGGFADSTGQSLHWLAQLHQQAEHRNFEEALIALDSLRSSPAGSLLEDDALYVISKSVPEQRVATYFIELNTYLQNATQTPLHERLLWERIQRAEQLISDPPQSQQSNQPDRPPTVDSSVTLPQSQKAITEYLEQLLAQYPTGFYADQARTKLRKLTEPEPATTS